jgi:hypothetical protein
VIPIPHHPVCVAGGCARTDTTYIDQEFAFCCARHAPEGLSWIEVLSVASLDLLRDQVSLALEGTTGELSIRAWSELAEDVERARIRRARIERTRQTR